MPDVEVKVSRLEQVLEEFIIATRESSQRAEMETAALREDLHNAYLRNDEKIMESRLRTDREIKESRQRTDEQIRESQQRTDERIDRLSAELKQFYQELKDSHQHSKKLQQQSDERINQLSAELKQSYQELKDSHQHSKELQQQSDERMNQLSAELKQFYQELKDSHQRNEEELSKWREEFKEFKAEGKEAIRQMNKKWGEMSNKLGTIVEDLVHPSLPRIIKHKFGLILQDYYIRRKKTLSRGRVKEFDCVGVSEKYVFLNSTKSTLRNKDAKEFLEDIKDFWEFCPEYRDKPLIGILAGLHADPSVVKHIEKKGFMVLCVGDSLMDVKNTKGFKPTVFHYPLNF